MAEAVTNSNTNVLWCVYDDRQSGSVISELTCCEWFLS